MNKLEPFGIFDQPLSEDGDRDGPSARGDEHAVVRPPPGYAEDGKPLPYMGILRKPLPPLDSGEYDAEFFKRYLALCDHYGLDPRNFRGLLAALMVRHVPGFRPDPPAPCYDEKAYGALAKALLGIRSRGQPSKPYELILPLAIQYYQETKRRNPRLSQVKICEMFLRQEQKRLERDFPNDLEWFQHLRAQTLARKVRERLRAEKKAT
jgi:hypothetical protein